jgi:hypothetical protein
MLKSAEKTEETSSASGERLFKLAFLLAVITAMGGWMWFLSWIGSQLVG